jgi:ribosomal protein L3
MHSYRSWSLCSNASENTRKDGYEAVQLGFGSRKEKNTPNALKGHFKKANTTPKQSLLSSLNWTI